jgi:hypothetical protein
MNLWVYLGATIVTEYLTEREASLDFFFGAPTAGYLAHRADPNGLVSDPEGGVSEKWTRLWLARTSGSVSNDALSQGWITEPKIGSTFRSDSQGTPLADAAKLN